jgi:hypothetical protein
LTTPPALRPTSWPTREPRRRSPASAASPCPSAPRSCPSRLSSQSFALPLLSLLHKMLTLRSFIVAGRLDRPSSVSPSAPARSEPEPQLLVRRRATSLPKQRRHSGRPLHPQLRRLPPSPSRLPHRSSARRRRRPHPCPTAMRTCADRRPARARPCDPGRPPPAWLPHARVAPAAQQGRAKARASHCCRSQKSSRSRCSTASGASAVRASATPTRFSPTSPRPRLGSRPSLLTPLPVVLSLRRTGLLSARSSPWRASTLAGLSHGDVGARAY